MTPDKKINNLKDSPSKKKEVIQLIEKSFSYSMKHNYHTDFYPQFSKNNLKNCYFIEHHDKVIAHVGVLPTKFNVANQTFIINFIGSIAVDIEFRGHGYFQYLFTSVLKKLKNSSALNILWSEKADLFQKYHFYESGEVLQTGTSNIDLNSKSIQDLTIKEIETITSLYCNYSEAYFCPTRTTSSFEIFKHIKTCKIKFLTKDNNVTGYILFSKGGDLQEIIHEFVSLPKYFDYNLKNLSKYKLWLPTNVGTSGTLMYTAMININCQVKFSNLYQVLTQKKLPSSYKGHQTLINLFGPCQQRLTNYPLWIPGINSI